MRRRALLATVAILAGLCLASRSQAVEIDAALSIEDGRVSSFYLAIGSHYQAADKDIIFVKKKAIPDDELVVVFYLAQRAGVAASVIVDLRLSGMTWMEIASRYHLTAKIFYLELTRTPGPPYGKAYGHFRKRKRDQWHEIRLSDDEIINLVNLRFVSAHYGFSADEIVKMREEGQSFIAIHDKVKIAKAQAKADKKAAKDSGKKGKGKGKKK